MVGIGIIEWVILLAIFGLVVVIPFVIILLVVGFSRRREGGLTNELMQLREENARLKQEVEFLKRSQ
jgi:cell division protein FtsB